MWQYSTETIINSNKGNLDGGKRVELFDIQGNAVANPTQANIQSSDTLLIDGVNSFILKYIKEISVYPYRASQNEEATIVVPTVNSGKPIRLSVILREQGRVSSIMQNAYLHNTKPFRYEVKSTGNAVNDATELVKIIKKDMARTDFPFFKADNAGGTSATITFTADDCYLRFKEISLDEIGNAPASGTGGYLGWQDFIPLVKGAVTAGKEGDEGAGTVTQLVKNLRIPTGASINPFGTDQGGRPIPGGEYDQWTIIYETPRHHVAGGVMGSVGETSRTQHTFFLERKGTRTEIEDLFNEISQKLFGVDLSTAYITKAHNTPKQEPGSVQ